MNSRDYWAKREAEALKHYVTDEKEYDKRIKQIYSDMLDACQKEINGFYGKYAAKEGITIAEAKKRVSKIDIEAYQRKAKRYVRDKDFSDKANEEMRLYNATMKINRLEMLKANIGLELIDGHEQLDKFMSDILKGRTEDELERQAGILGKTVKSNAKKVDAIVNGSFKVAKVGSKSTFSDYIWQYQDLMREELGKILQTGLIRGKNPRAIAKDLRKYWYGADPKTNGGAVYCMERLMRTELARVQTEAQKQSFERNGFDQYIFIVNGGCCPICEALKDKHFPVAKMMPGENAPPMHPNCRCSVAAYSDRAEYEAWLDYLESGGTTEEWEAMKQRAAEREKQYGVMYGEAAKAVNWDFINSAEYRKQFDNITDSPEANKAIYEVAKTILKHRDDTEYEDIYLLDMDGGIISAVTNSTSKMGVNYTDEFIAALENCKQHGIKTIAIHNHPEGTPPSADDFKKAYENEYFVGVAVGNNGQVYVYRNTDVELSEKMVEAISEDIQNLYRLGLDIDKASKMVYNDRGLDYSIEKGAGQYGI